MYKLPMASNITNNQMRPDAGAFLDDLFARKDEFLDMAPYRGIGDAESFFTKIVGVTFEGRQDVLRSLREGDDLMLERQPENPYDANAIAVRYGQLQLGFIRREIARELAPHIDGGRSYRVSITGITGGSGKSIGVNICVAVRSLSLQRKPHIDVNNAEQHLGRDDVQRALLGERHLRESQIAVLDRVFSGKRTLAVLGTGRGKSLCFQLPAATLALETGAKTLVLYPLRALANDQFEAMRRKFEPLGLRIFRANGAIDGVERAALLEALNDGNWDIILSTPEFVQFHGERFMDEANRPELIVIDEAHHIFESKHRPAYSRIGSFIESAAIRRVLALTATARGECFNELRRALGIEHWVIDPTVRDNLHLVDARNIKDKAAYLSSHIRADGKAIIYCNSRTEATKVAEMLRMTMPAVAFYHAGMGTKERGEVERLFREGSLRTVVATSAFGEGIDLPDVRDVFLYHLNFNFTEFNQQAGRAGRDGAEAHIHLLYGESDRRINDYILSKSAPTLGILRELYRLMLQAAGEERVFRMTYADFARTIDLDRVDDATVGIAVRIFADAGLVTVGSDDDGRFVRFMCVQEKVDITQTSRYAEGIAERENFDGFCELALKGNVLDLERIMNRPMYPDGVAFER